jgi:hypothetical protein
MSRVSRHAEFSKACSKPIWNVARGLLDDAGFSETTTELAHSLVADTQSRGEMFDRKRKVPHLVAYGLPGEATDDPKSIAVDFGATSIKLFAFGIREFGVPLLCRPNPQVVELTQVLS